MANLAQPVGDAIHGRVVGEPVVFVESAEVERRGVAPQSLFAFHVVILLEVRQHQLAQGAKDRLAVAQAGEVGFGDCAPVVVAFVERQHVVVVAVGGEHVNDERRMAEPAQGGGGEGGAVEAVTDAVAQDPERATINVFGTVSQRIEEGLNFGRAGEAGEELTLGFGEQVVKGFGFWHLTLSGDFEHHPIPEFQRTLTVQ